MLASSPIAPPWLALTLGVLAAVVIAGHLMALQESTRRGDVPPSRWRIRAVNGLLMLVSVPLLAYAFGIATPANPGAFILVWTMVTMVLAVVLLLAAVDMLNTWRLLSVERQRRRIELRAARRALLLLAAERSRAQDPDRLRLNHDEPGDAGDR